jgi:hypothetical protein
MLGDATTNDAKLPRASCIRKIPVVIAQATQPQSNQAGAREL